MNRFCTTMVLKCHGSPGLFTNRYVFWHITSCVSMNTTSSKSNQTSPLPQTQITRSSCKTTTFKNLLQHWQPRYAGHQFDGFGRFDLQTEGTVTLDMRYAAGAFRFWPWRLERAMWPGPFDLKIIMPENGSWTIRVPVFLPVWQS